jgi:hypothetical protein
VTLTRGSLPTVNQDGVSRGILVPIESVIVRRDGKKCEWEWLSSKTFAFCMPLQ